MKTILGSAFTVVVALALAVNSASATGAVGTDVPQSGILNFTASTGVYITNSFAYPYSQVPIVQFQATLTNAIPITNVFVTTTNFAVSANTTNSQIAWNSYAGYQRIQYGTNAIQGSLLLTNVFNPAYAYAPVVSVEGSTTNIVKGSVAISSITPTQVVFQFGDTNQVIYWMAIGTSYAPGNNVVTK